ncbi:MAG: hypothetical protein V9G04_13235 [Nocardioides sp.]
MWRGHHLGTGLLEDADVSSLGEGERIVGGDRELVASDEVAAGRRLVARVGAGPAEHADADGPAVAGLGGGGRRVTCEGAAAACELELDVLAHLEVVAGVGQSLDVLGGHGAVDDGGGSGGSSCCELVAGLDGGGVCGVLLLDECLELSAVTSRSSS